MVAVVLRHGDRTALYKYPFEANYTWKEGLAALTQKGMVQAFNVGVELRRKYINHHQLISEVYNLRQLAAYTTHYERTRDTLTALLIGLYPPRGGRMSPEQGRCHCRLRGKPSSPTCIANCI
eukprot:9171823-Pyramimonas_sp.AAC.1